MTETLGTILVLMMLGIMASRRVAPLAAKITGRPVLEVPLRPIFRLLDQRINIIAILAVLILGSGFVGERWISHGLFLFAVIVMIGILAFPTIYRFTTDGVSPNRSTFRAWSDFDGWAASGNVVHLNGPGRFSSLKLYIAERDREPVIALLKRYLPANSLARPTAELPVRPSRQVLRKKGGAR